MLHNSTRVWLVRFYNPDPVIGKFVVRSRQFKLGHVARYAFVFSNRTRLGSGLATRMTGQTFAVEIHRFGLEVMMRIVAGQTTDARILRVITFAARQAVWLDRKSVV